MTSAKTIRWLVKKIQTEKFRKDLKKKIICCYNWVLRCSLTSLVISVTFYIEREKSDKFCSEALILASGSFMCRKSTTRGHQLYLPFKEVICRIFTLWKIHRPRPGLNSQTSDPEASMITTGPSGSTILYFNRKFFIYVLILYRT